MKPELSRERFTTVGGQSLERLVVDGQPAALIGAFSEDAAKLLVSFERVWRWWVVVGGVDGNTWLLRDASRASDFPLTLGPQDQPFVVLSSHEANLAAAEPKKKVRTRRPSARRAEETVPQRTA